MSANRRPDHSIAVIGLWHQGCVGAACLAEVGYSVKASGGPPAVRDGLRQGKAPLFEPGLDDLLAKGLAAGSLQVIDHTAEAVSGCDIVLIMHDTPVDEHDCSDLTPVFDDVRSLIPGLSNDVVVYVTAQVPVGTCHKLAALIREARPELRFGIAYTPENLRLGQAIERFCRPPLPVIGSDQTWVLDRIESMWSVYDVQWQRTNLCTAEMVKHGLNTFLATSITLGNELGNLCDEVGADGHRLAELLRMEPRIGPKAMLFPGLGFAGGTLARDAQSLRHLGDRQNIETPLLDGVWQSNQQQNALVIRKLMAAFGGSLKNKAVAIWGITYKPDTSTLRRSAAIDVARDLASHGCTLSATDPKADRAELALLDWLPFKDDPYDAAANVDALVLMTPWSDYRGVDIKKLATAMRGRVVLDTANFWNASEWESEGFLYLDIGRGRRPERR